MRTITALSGEGGGRGQLAAVRAGGGGDVSIRFPPLPAEECPQSDVIRLELSIIYLTLVMFHCEIGIPLVILVTSTFRSDIFSLSLLTWKMMVEVVKCVLLQKSGDGGV